MKTEEVYLECGDSRRFGFLFLPFHGFPKRSPEARG
jgi:hypothetical protein